MLDKLPSDIASLILKQAVGVQAQCTKSWKETIRLSFVSKRIRILAKPWIHYWAFVECYDAPEEEISDDDDEYIDEPVWMTNIDFHALCGWTFRIRKLELYLDAPVPIYTFINKSIKTLDMPNAKWEHIRSLNIGMYSVLDEVDDLDMDEHEQQVGLTKFATRLSQILVNVTKLNISAHLSHHTNIVSAGFATALANLYSSQLQSLFNQLPIDPSALTYSDNLKYVGMFIDATSLSENFRLNSISLESIMLVNVPLSFSWNMLESESGVGIYDYPKLQTIEMIFDSPRASVDSPPNTQSKDSSLQLGGHLNTKVVRLNMPKLRYLRLEYASPECPIFHSESVFPCLKDIHICGPISVIKHLLRLGLSDVDRVEIYVDSIVGSDEKEFYKVTNHLFNEINISKRAFLTIRGSIPFTIDPDKVKWTFLKELCFEYKLQFMALMGILHHMPSLRALLVKELCFESFIADVGHIDSPRWTKMIKSPVNNNLEAIHIMGMFAQYSTLVVSNVIYFLIQRLPGLQTARIGAPAFKDQINMLLKQSETPHPQVQHVIVADLEEDTYLS